MCCQPCDRDVVEVDVAMEVTSWRLRAEKAKESAQLTKNTAKHWARTHCLCRNRMYISACVIHIHTANNHRI